MSVIKSSADHMTINADGSGKNILFQANGVQVASISSDGDLACNSVAVADDGNIIGSEKKFFTYKDRTAYGYLPFSFDNEVLKTGTYALLYAEVGDIFEVQHTDAGDSIPTSGYFYPTPIPGAYSRSGIPDISVSGTTATLPTGFRNGTLFLVKSGTDQAAGTELFLRRTGVSTVTYHSSEAGAIANTGAITVTGVGILTQEGIYLDDAMKGWQAGGLDVTNKFGFLAGNGYLSQAIIQTNHSLPYFSTTGQGSAAKITAVSDTVNGPVNPTNETRPKTSITFGYIKAEHVTTSGEPISALRYDTGWINRSDWTNVHLGSDITKNTDSNVTHGLSANLSDLIVDVLVSTDGTSEATLEANSFSVGGIAAGTSQGRGYEVRQVDTNNLEIQTGNAGMYFLDTNGNGAGIDTESWFYKVVVTKPNLVATAFDVSNMPKTYDLTSADVTVTLPAISGVLQTKSIYWTNGGTYKLSLSSSETVGGLAALTWEGEGEGHMLLESDGTNWQVREYEDTGSDFIKHADGWADVWGNAFSSTTTSSPNKFGTTSGNAYYGDGTFTYPFTAASAPSRDNIILSLVDGTSLAVYLSASTITTTQINNIRTWSNVVSTAVKVSVNVKLRWRT